MGDRTEESAHYIQNVGIQARESGAESYRADLSERTKLFERAERWSAADIEAEVRRAFGTDSLTLRLTSRRFADLRDGRRLVEPGPGETVSIGPPIVLLEAGADEIDAAEVALSIRDVEQQLIDLSRADLTSRGWKALARRIKEEGIQIDEEELKKLPIKVELDDRVRGRLNP